MGCCFTKESISRPGDRPETVTGETGGKGSLEHNGFVRELFDEDVREVYDFTGPVLGSGAFATVLRVKDKTSGMEYAIKQIDLSVIKEDETLMQMLYNEIQGMKVFSHPNIVRLQEVYMPPDGNMLYLVLDKLEGGSVEALRNQEGHLEEGHTAYIMAQVVDAVRYCHSLNTAHRDLKLANCMFEDNSQAPIVKVIDFGLCREFKDGKTSSAFVGTMTHAAPEVIAKDQGHGLECDMWSVGVMTYLLLCGKLPYNTKEAAALGHQIRFMPHAYNGEVWKGVSTSCRDFIDKCLVKDPHERITAKQAQAHPWIKSAAKAMEGEPLSKGAMMSMVKFQETNLFEKLAMELVAYSYEPSEIRDLERHFREMDVEGAGAVSLCEFKAAILGRRKEIIEQYNMRKNSASPTTTNGESTRSLPSTESNDSVIHEESKGEDTKRTAEVGNGHVAPGDGAVRTESRTAGDQSVGGDRSMGTGEEKSAEASTGNTTNEENATTSARDPGGRGPTAKNQFRGLDEEGVECIFEAMDVDGTGKISITEFVAACLAKRQINDKSITAAFNRLDFGRTGTISVDDMSMYLGDSFDRKAMTQYMRKISSRKDGLVNFEDFSKCLKEHALTSRFSVRGGSQRTSPDPRGARKVLTEKEQSGKQ